MMEGFYGRGVAVALEREEVVDEELKRLFKNLMPTPQEVDKYFR